MLTSTRLWVQTQAGSPVWGLHVYQWKMHLLKPFLAQVPSLLNSSSIFLSLDSNRADFMIHSLKYVFLFCFVFSSTLVQPWVHAFSETSARSHVDEQQNTPFLKTLFLCVHEHKSLQCVSNVFRNEAFFIILSRQSGDVLPQQPINPYNKPKKWLPLYYNKKHEIFLTLSSDFNA